jgi:hypothetical protein
LEALVWRQVITVSNLGVAEDSLKVGHRDRAGVQADQALDSNGLGGHGRQVRFADAYGLQIGGDVQVVGKAADRGNGSLGGGVAAEGGSNAGEFVRADLSVEPRRRGEEQRIAQSVPVCLGVEPGATLGA